MEQRSRSRVLVLIGVAVALTVFAGVGTASAATPKDAKSTAETHPSASEACAAPCAYIYLKVVGAGNVTSSPDPEINCPPTCSGFFNSWEYNSVLLTPTEAPGGQVFRGWEGCPPGAQTGRACRIQMDEGSTFCLKAVFEIGGVETGAECPSPGTPPPPAPPQPPPPANAVCTITGTPGSDVLTGTPLDDVICGGGGNDRIDGGEGHDLLRGGAGSDLLRGGNGNDKLYGGGGNDQLRGAAGRDRLYGELGADRLIGGTQFDTYSGGDGADTLVARDSVRETLNGGRGRDRARRDRSDRLRSVERLF